MSSVAKDKCCLCLITGASRGIGREICNQLSQIVSKSSVFIITARNGQKLLECKNIIERNINRDNEVGAPSAVVKTVVCDMSKIEEYLDEFHSLLREITNRRTFDTSLIVHNGGSIGDVGEKAADLKDAVKINQYLQENVTSMIILNNKVLDFVTENVSKCRLIVNISSLAAVKGVPSFAYYCTAKAAREGYLRVLAVEEPNLRVLNYSPGPVDTDMTRFVAAESHDENIRSYFYQGRMALLKFSEEKAESDIVRSMLTAEVTVKKLITLISENQFESGSRIDYFDD